MAEMLKGGVIMDVVTPEQARIAEGAGAVAVMALERVPADIRAQGGVSRMSDPDMIEGIISAVTIPVMAKARIGHFVEAQILQSLGVDYVDESEVLTPADYAHHIDKWKFTVPFVCGATNLGEALRRITEGAAMIRSKGEAGTGDVSNATTHMRKIGGEIRRLTSLSEDELYVAAKELQAPYELVVEVARAGKLPVTLFTAGGIATPADAAMMMQLGAEGVFVGSGIFKSGDPAAARRGDRQGHHLLRRPRRAGEGVARAGRGHGRHQRGGHRGRRTGSPSAAGKPSACRSREILDLEQLEVNIYRGSVFSPESGNLAAHVRRPCRRSVAGVRGTHGRPALPGALAARLLPAAGRCQGAHGLHRRTAARRRLVRHPAGQRDPARRDHLLDVGVVSDRPERHRAPGRHAVGAAAGRSAGPRSEMRAFDDAGFEQFAEWDVRIVPQEKLDPACRARPPSSRCGSATRDPLPDDSRAAHLRAGLHERPDAAGFGAGPPPGGAQAPA